MRRILSRGRLFVGVLLGFWAAWGIVANPVIAEVRLGIARVKITPPPGTPMAGYYHPRGAEGVHDDLWSTALVLESGTAKAAMVSLDLISTTRWFVEEARGEVEKKTGIPAAHVMISATHSHTGPILSKTSSRYDDLGGHDDLAVRYSESLPGLITQSVSAAVAALKPMTVETAIGEEHGLAYVRRFFMTDGTVGWNPGKLNPKIVRPTGPIDPSVPVVAFLHAGGPLAGRPAAVYANFSIHLDCIGGAQISADMPYTLCKQLRESLGQDVGILYTSGCCGDVNHINVKSGRRQGGHEEGGRIGTILAANVLRSLEHSLKPASEGPLVVRSKIVQLPLAPVTPEEAAPAEAVIARSRDRNQPQPPFLELVKAYQVVDVLAKKGEPISCEVQVITLGRDVAWVSLPGEIFVQLGLDIKAASPFGTTIITELANGSVGYVPTRVAYSQGNYEVISARCAEGSGEILVDTAIELLRANYSN